MALLLLEDSFLLDMEKKPRIVTSGDSELI